MNRRLRELVSKVVDHMWRNTDVSHVKIEPYSGAAYIVHRPSENKKKKQND